MHISAGSQWIIMLGLAVVGCRGTSYAERGMGMGAGIGGVTGAMLAGQRGNPVAGAAVGAAVGAATGSVIGHSIDEDVARNEARLAERMGRRLNGPVTPPQVIEMTASGVEDSVIISHIQSHGVVRPPRVEDVISMSKQGVDAEVIKAMERSRLPSTTARVPVVVEEHYHGPWRWRPPRARQPWGRRRPGFRWGLSFGS